MPGNMPLRTSVPCLLATVCGFLLAASALAGGQNAAKDSSPSGVWQGAIATPIGATNFLVDIQLQGSSVKATLINGSDRQPFTSGSWDGHALTLHIDYYDGTLTAHFVGPQRMEGSYSRLTANGQVDIPLTLVPYTPEPDVRPWSGVSLTGNWMFRRPGVNGMDKITPGEFEQQTQENSSGRVAVTGVFEPVSGDSGLLHGYVWNAPQGGLHFSLSRFDGIHVMLFDGELQPDGTLKGRLAGVKLVTPFTAVRAKETSTSSIREQAATTTTVRDPQEPFRFSGVDSSGKPVNQDSPQFKNKAVIVDIFGTWCPNCHDEAPVLERLYREHRGEGLEIVGLAYEYTDNQARDLKQIAIYQAKYGITFPLLLSGTTADGQIEKTLPQLVGFGAFPTTIFLDRDGHVHAIHAGFQGPATGEKYTDVQNRFEQLVGEILGSSH